MKKLLILFFIMAFFAFACTQQPPQEQAVSTPSVETALEPFDGQSLTATAEPVTTSYAVTESFIDEVTSNMPHALLKGLSMELFEPLWDYYYSFQIAENEDSITLLFVIEDADLAQTIKNAYAAEYGPLENGCFEVADNIGVYIGMNGDETGVEFSFDAADYPDFKPPEYYAEQIHLPDILKNAHLVGRMIRGFEWGEKIVYECEYELPEDTAQTIIESCTNELSGLVGYQVYEGTWDGAASTEYRALLAPGAELYAVSTQEMLLFEVTLTPLTILNSGFAFDAAKDPANTLLSEEAKEIALHVKADDTYISVKRGENTFYCDMFFEFFEDADEVAAFIAEEYGVADALQLLQQGQDIEIALEQGSITVEGFEYPQALRIVVATNDDGSLQRMNEVFAQYPDALFPAFPESIPSEFDGDFIGVGNGSFSYYQTYSFDISDYNDIVDWFRNYFESNYGEAWVVYGDRSTSISMSVENLYLEVFVDQGDEFNTPSVQIKLVH